MNTIELRSICIHDTYEFELTGEVLQHIAYANATYEFGKVYGLIGELVFSVPGISWCVSGEIVPTEGVILVDGEPATRRLLRNISHRVWVEPKKSWPFEKTVRSWIREALRKHSYTTLSFDEVVETFGLTRLDRPMTKISGERWRTSIAIGFLQGKRVFCFPWLWHHVVEMYRDVWMKRVFDFLRENHCLVLVPTNNDQISAICDEVAYFR